MNRELLGLVALLGVSSSCQCTPTVKAASAELVFVMTDAAGGQRVEPQGEYDFEATALGEERELTVVVRNQGLAAATVTGLELQRGDGVAVGARSGEPFSVAFAPFELAPASEKRIVAKFHPAVEAGQRGFEATLALVSPDDVAAPSTFTLRAVSLMDPCFVPRVVDFGAVLVGRSERKDVSLANGSARHVTAILGTLAGDATFTLTQPNGPWVLEPGSNQTLGVRFAPTEAIEYAANVTVRRAPSCPQVTVRFRGAGVSQCLSWRVSPPDGTDTTRAQFGYAPLGAQRAGEVQFSNLCSTAVEVRALSTNSPAFSVGQEALSVPGGVRVEDRLQPGEATLGLVFSPQVIGPVTGQLTGLTSQSMPVHVNLRGGGGGPDIDVRPAGGLNFGRVGYFPGVRPASFAQRRLLVANVGTLPTPADPRANLKLGAQGQGTAWTVRALQGSPEELCVGSYDDAQERCVGTIDGYDAAEGIAATAGAALSLPVRLVPNSLGRKEFELTIHSNDADEPDTVVHVVGSAEALPPCLLEVSPSMVEFGALTPGTPKDVVVRFTNLAQRADQRCVLGGFEFTPDSSPVFSFVTPPPAEIELGAGESSTLTLRAAASPSVPAGRPLTGLVTFQQSSPGQPQGRLALSAVVVPGCLSIVPAPVDFGNVEAGCLGAERSITVVNSCPSSVTLNRAAMLDAGVVSQGTGDCTLASGCPQFVVTQQPATLLGALLPGQSRSVSVRYRPYEVGAHRGTYGLNVTVAGVAVDFPVQLRGVGVAPEQVGVCGIAVVCPPPQVVLPNTMVSLNPSAMGGAGSASCAWSTSSRPQTANGMFSAPTSCSSTNYFADVVGTHVVRFTATDASGRAASCESTVEVRPRGDFWVELTWDVPNDMDLHLLHPAGGAATTPASWAQTPWDCYFANRTPTWDMGGLMNPSLDRDDIPGVGPENMRVERPSTTHPYTVGVRMYSWAASPQPVTATVKVYCGGQLMTTEQRTFAGLKDFWVVGEVDFSAVGVPCRYTPSGYFMNVP